MLNMAVLVGLSVSEALICAPGLIYDMLELKARQNGREKENEESVF